MRRMFLFDPFSLEVWDPIQGFPFSPSPFPPLSSSAGDVFVHAAHMDWKETSEAHVFKVDLPGLNKEEVKVEDDRILQINNERTREREEKTDMWHRTERSSGRFLRRFRLPENAKVDSVKAEMADGVLTVTMPKVEAKKHNLKSIDISG